MAETKKTTAKAKTATKVKAKTTTEKAPTVKSEWGKKEIWYQRHETDTWSPEYQIFLISEKIAMLQAHLKINHKDYDAKRSLLRLVARRRQHLKYLKLNDLERYGVVSKRVGIKA